MSHICVCIYIYHIKVYFTIFDRLLYKKDSPAELDREGSVPETEGQL